MIYQTREGFIEVVEKSKEDGSSLVYENGNFRGEGRVLFCSSAPMSMEMLNVVNDPIGAVLVFWHKDDTSTSPSFISSEIINAS
jgi:hypothetical protein